MRLQTKRLWYYFTSKIEIKPQQTKIRVVTNHDYFTSKIEIKPQLEGNYRASIRIILHQK